MIKFKICLLFVLLNLICTQWLFAQKIIDLSPTSARLYRDMAVLASDSLEGREAGTLSERKAADYIAKQMQSIGLLPKGGHEGSYLSAFRINFPVIFKEAKLRINSIDFKHKDEFGATDLSSAGTVEGELIKIGNSFNFFEPNALNNYQIKDKIVLLDIASKVKLTENEAITNEIVSKVKAVVESGAIGVILYNSSRKTTEDVLFGSPFTESVGVPVVYIARLPFNKIRKVKSGTCSLTVEINRTVSKPENVIGWIDNKSDKTVVIGAHFDHVGITRSRTGDDKSLQIHNGADDNASGTTTLLELARWAANNETLKYNYIFAAFSAEEKGLFGSKAFCSRAWVNNQNIAYMLNLDMVGRLGCQGDTISALGVASSEVWENVLDKLEHPDFSVKKINGAPPFSDHSPFLKKNIPIMYFTTGLHPDYHTPNDDIEFINFKGMEEILAYIRQFIRSAEALPEIPFHNINPIQQTKAYLQTF
jgi:Zn-dependent M28 family amino/carboxypeptidase